MDDFDEVCEDLGRWTHEALFGGFLDCLAEAALVEPEDEDAPCGKAGEEVVVAVAVVAETVDEDELCSEFDSGLGKC